MIKAADISFSISGKNILRDISFEVTHGELLVILGSNGAGKSTLLKILSGELKSATGYIDIDNKSLHNWTAKELATIRAVLQQHTMLTLPFTVSEVVMMGRYPHFGHKPHAIDRLIVKNALKKTGTEHLTDRNYLTLSGGEQQRVQLARIFAQIWNSAKDQPRYLLMDEPVNSLDIRHQHTTLQLAKDFAKEGNCAIAVLHDLNLAMQYADKVLILRKGEMVCFGNTREALSSELISYAYDFPLHILDHSYDTHPVIIPALTNNKITT